MIKFQLYCQRRVIQRLFQNFGSIKYRNYLCLILMVNCYLSVFDIDLKIKLIFSRCLLIKPMYDNKTTLKKNVHRNLCSIIYLHHHILCWFMPYWKYHFTNARIFLNYSFFSGSYSFRIKWKDFSFKDFLMSPYLIFQFSSLFRKFFEKSRNNFIWKNWGNRRKNENMTYIVIIQT